MRFSSFVAAVACSSLAVVIACGPGNVASNVAKAPTYAPEGQTKCAVKQSQTEPLIVEWPSPARAKLESRRRHGLVVVKYTGCEMQVLECSASAVKYDYLGITRKHDRVSMRDADELYANIPIGAAKLESQLHKSGELNVTMVIVGRYEAAKAHVSAEELSGPDCNEATHIVSAMTVGAFDFFAGADADVGAGVAMPANVAGAGAHSASKKQLLNEDGDEKSCDVAKSSDGAPPEGCGALLRLEVVPVGVARASHPECTGGTEWDGNQCLAKKLAAAVDCPPGTTFNGTKCAAVVDTSCSAGMHFVEGKGCVANGAPTPPPEPAKIEVPIPPNAPWRGAENAKVVIQEFGDFQGPFCARVEGTLADLMQDYPGKLKIVWRHFPLAFHKDAFLASNAAIEAYKQRGNAGFWKVHDLMFSNVLNLSRATLDGYSIFIGVDRNAWRQSMDGMTHKAEIDADIAAGTRVGVNGNPVFFINGTMLMGAQPADAFRKVIDKALAEAK